MAFPLIPGERYTVELTRRAQKDLEDLRSFDDRVVEALATLEANPRRVLPGEGGQYLVTWLNEIKRATGYDGFVSLELFNPEIRALDPTVAALRCVASIDRLLQGLAG